MPQTLAQTTEETATSTVPEEPQPAQPAAGEQELVLDELLVEDVSIDGMCGVY